MELQINNLLKEYQKPNPIEFQSLLKKVQKGDEEALDKLYDLFDKIVNENIEFQKRLNIINTITSK